MALEFYKRRFRKPSKKTQYILAFIGLLLAMTLVFGWMAVMQAPDDTSSDDPSSTSAITYTAEDAADLLVVVSDEEAAQFILVHADPANKAIRVTDLPEDAISTDGLSLTPLYRKHGAAYVANQLAEKTDRPLRHFVAVSRSNAEKWFARLGNDLTLTLKKDVVFTDESDKQTTLTAGEHTLNASQATALIMHDNGAEIIAAMLKQYLVSGRNLTADFSYLANMAQTGLRIGDFNSYRERLIFLAKQNTDGCCTITTH